LNGTINKQTEFRSLGLIDYKKAWDYQTELFQQTLAVKSGNRDRSINDQQPTNNFLLFCEHPHVFTLGKSGDANNLLLQEEMLKMKNAAYYHSNRGGDITYHGPGQLVGYPIIDLENFFTDIHQYMRLLEESIICTLKDFNIEAGRIAGLTGVWVDFENKAAARKICALGVKTSRWVTMHGFALNINTDLNYFDYIVPCGIKDKAVTSLAKELGEPQDFEKVSDILKENFARLFEMDLLEEKVKK
jgi:lipoyl(octanoyl) transferase